MKFTVHVAFLLAILSGGLFIASCSSQSSNKNKAAEDTRTSHKPHAPLTAADYLACSSHKECSYILQRNRCCSGCGNAPHNYVPVNRKGLNAIGARRIQKCEAAMRKCPLVNCPNINYCIEKTPRCLQGKCTLKFATIPNCKRMVPGEQTHTTP